MALDWGKESSNLVKAQAFSSRHFSPSKLECLLAINPIQSCKNADNLRGRNNRFPFLHPEDNGVTRLQIANKGHRFSFGHLKKWPPPIQHPRWYSPSTGWSLNFEQRALVISHWAVSLLNCTIMLGKEKNPQSSSQHSFCFSDWIQVVSHFLPLSIPNEAAILPSPGLGLWSHYSGLLRATMGSSL